jgi:ribonuclease VapC
VVLDTSSLVAMLLGEAEADAMIAAIARDGVRLVAAPTLVEASAVMLARKGPAGELALDALLERLDARVVVMSVPAAKLARLAYARFGKGVGDPAVLNLGDCLAYGVAMAEREPLLFKGDDFTRTDVTPVAY